MEMIAEAAVQIMDEGLLLEAEEGKIKGIKQEEEMNKLEREEQNKWDICFEGFLKHKCWCIFSIIIVETVISIALMAIILMSWGHKEEEICFPMTMKTSTRRLSNQESTSKSLQIIS
jgi:hypothetical protein